MRNAIILSLGVIFFLFLALFGAGTGERFGGQVQLASPYASGRHLTVRTSDNTVQLSGDYLWRFVYAWDGTKWEQRDLAQLLNLTRDNVAGSLSQADNRFIIAGAGSPVSVALVQLGVTPPPYLAFWSANFANNRWCGGCDEAGNRGRWQVIKTNVSKPVFGVVKTQEASELGQLRVGVHYHATSTDFNGTAFLRDYHNPLVRENVLGQLQRMAVDGIDVINTDLLLYEDQETHSDRFLSERWRLHFPPTAQELANLRQYIMDVASLRTRENRPVRFYLTFRYAECSNYRYITREDTFDIYPGSNDAFYPLRCHLASVQDYRQKMATSIVSVMETIAPLHREDNSKAVDLIYVLPEVRIPTSKGDDVFLLNFAEFIIQQAVRFGVMPSVYFHFEGGGINDMQWLTNSLDFMRANNISVPQRIDFSFYPTMRNRLPDGSIDYSTLSTLRRPNAEEWDEVVKYFFDRLESVLPAGTKVAIAETYYSPDQQERTAFGKALATEVKRRHMLEEVVFWSTPGFGTGGVRVHVPSAFPWDFRAYKPTVQ